MFDVDLRVDTWDDDFWDVMDNLSISEYYKFRNYLIDKNASKLSKRLINIIYICYMRGILPVYNFDIRRV